MGSETTFGMFETFGAALGADTAFSEDGGMQKASFKQPPMTPEPPGIDARHPGLEFPPMCIQILRNLVDFKPPKLPNS